jgi:hypothetical protein
MKLFVLVIKDSIEDGDPMYYQGRGGQDQPFTTSFFHVARFFTNVQVATTICNDLNKTWNTNFRVIGYELTEIK